MSFLELISFPFTEAGLSSIFCGEVGRGPPVARRGWGWRARTPKRQSQTMGTEAVLSLRLVTEGHLGCPGHD